MDLRLFDLKKMKVGDTIRGTLCNSPRHPERVRLKLEGSDITFVIKPNRIWTPVIVRFIDQKTFWPEKLKITRIEDERKNRYSMRRYRIRHYD